MGGGGDRMPFETLHSKDIKMPHVYHISSQTGGTHYKKRFQTLQTLLYTQNSHFGHLPLYASSFCPCPSFPPPPSSSSRAPLPLSLPLPLPGPLPLSLSVSLSLPLSLSPSPSPFVFIDVLFFVLDRPGAVPGIQTCRDTPYLLLLLRGQRYP